MSEAPSIHRPVLLREALEALEALAPASNGLIVDCTFGRGGHSRAILNCLGSAGRLLALDKDPDAVASPEAAAVSADSRCSVEHGSFARLREIAGRRDWVGRVSGVLMDLGVSSPQLDEGERGFSFMRSGPLDMRMDTSRGETAAEWLAKVSDSELARVLRDFGEERYSRRIAHALVTRRTQRPFLTTGDLAEAIERAVPSREKGKHPATRSFQAIRIAINQELDELAQGLDQALEILQPGGRLVVIAFHSLEDRIVKRFMRDEERGGGPVDPRLPFVQSRPARLKRIGKATLPDELEVAENPRARSAVMRVAERLA